VPRTPVQLDARLPCIIQLYDATLDKDTRDLVSISVIRQAGDIHTRVFLGVGRACVFGGQKTVGQANKRCVGEVARKPWVLLKLRVLRKAKAGQQQTTRIPSNKAVNARAMQGHFVRHS
jgi:hypothetical protein